MPNNKPAKKSAAPRKSNNPRVKAMEDVITLGYSNELLERIVLAGVLGNKETFDECIKARITYEDFYDLPCAQTYQAIMECYEENGVPPDLLVVSEHLKKKGLWDRIGGQSWFAEVLGPLMGEGLLGVNAYIHVRMLREYANRRKIHNAGLYLISISFDPTKRTDQIMELMEERVQKVCDKINFRRLEEGNISNLTKNAVEAIEWARAQDSDSFLGYKTGYPAFDDIVGAFAPGTLNIIAARPSMGKTALALNMIHRGIAADEKQPVIFFSLEMTPEQILHRFLAMSAKVEITRIRRATLTDSEMSLIYTMAHYLQDMKLIIEDTPDLSVSAFKNICKRYHRQHKGLALIMVDYLQLMRSDKDYHGNRTAEVSEISKALKAISVELKCPVVALSQLSRETEKRTDKKPKLSDLRDSGSIEQDADTVSLLYRENYYEEFDPKKVAEYVDDIAEINIAKNRNGPTGVCRLAFHREFTRFDILD